jgi:hypothetical protein
LAFFTPVERSTAHLPTLGQPKSQAKTKPNQAGLLLLLLMMMILNQQTKSSLLTYCFAPTNKQTNQPKTNQPTPLPTPTQNKQKNPPQTKQNKTKGFCFKVQTTKTKYHSLATYKSLRKKTKQNTK